MRWPGVAWAALAYQQLTGYLQRNGSDSGYLVVFDTRKDRKPREEWIEKNGCKLFEVVL
jgi:hypothetical protein